MYKMTKSSYNIGRRGYIIIMRGKKTRSNIKQNPFKK